MTSSTTAEADFEWSFDAVVKVSRTFAITVEELEEPMRREICVGYLVCRAADTIEDDPRIPPARRAELLRQYDRALDPGDAFDRTDFAAAVREWIPADPDAEWQLVSDVPRLLATFDALDPEARERIRPPVREMVQGLASFVDRHPDSDGVRIRTVEELEEYCWYAAGTVGDLVTNLVTIGDDSETKRRLQSNAEAFGLLLQLVNVAKDVGTDYDEEDSVYLPEEWLDDAGLSADDAGDPSSAERFAPVVNRVVSHAETYLDGAQEWLESMPCNRGNTLSAWAIPFLLAVGTIRELQKRPTDPVSEGNVKVSREEVYAVRERFRRGATADDLATLRDRIQRRPLHEY